MAPVYHGRWVYNIDTLYVTTSCGAVHARASYAELDDIFSTPLGAIRTRPDNPGHWWEAQLFHYGLAPTTNKAAAKMRLMDAYQDGRLKVPDEVFQIEDTLHRNWINQGLGYRVLGPAMQLSRGAGVVNEPRDIDMIDSDATQGQSGGEHGNIFAAGLNAGAGMQGNLRHERNEMQPPHPETNKRKDANGDPCTRPFKTPRCRSDNGTSDLQTQIDSPDADTLYERSPTPEPLGNGRGRLIPGMVLQNIQYRAVPVLRDGTSESGTQLPLFGLMDLNDVN
ncbi:uncharacterized protein PGRI_019420 [Penicillium griseofulvum]|uniref:Uncharacterized protein n=1 Tax=Penicillium patulum TaxID=5078 RepID=A0A135LGG5_PENPA|nr:uncharacterized protein PGRI_019420 [Penicillium griseofulvum]KXG48072.1 hypothetical protein PGRI_019420 [Penicillium griseofulvum]